MLNTTAINLVPILEIVYENTNYRVLIKINSLNVLLYERI